MKVTHRAQGACVNPSGFASLYSSVSSGLANIKALSSVTPAGSCTKELELKTVPVLDL